MPDRATTVARPFRDGDVLVRITARDRSWPSRLPPVPAGGTVTVTLGHPRLTPDDELAAGGYRVVGTASEHRPIGAVVDVLVPRVLREAHPDWWSVLGHAAERVFDLRLGPVQRVLAAELELHARALLEGVAPV